MKKRMLSLLLCACMLVSALGAAALAAEDETPSHSWGDTALYLDGEKMIPTAEGTTHTFENGGVATLTTVGQNEAGGTDYALTLENVWAFRSMRHSMGDSFNSATLFFFTPGKEAVFAESKDTLTITLKGQNTVSIQGQADEANAGAVVANCPVTLTGDGSLSVIASAAEGAEVNCYDIKILHGDLRVGASLTCMARQGETITLGGELSLTDGATLRWPLKLALSEPEGDQRYALRTLMNGETPASIVVVAAPTDAVTRSVAVFNLWQAMGAPAPEGEFPFTDSSTRDLGEIPLQDAIHWAGVAGITKGCGDGRFNSNDTITLEQFGVMLYRMVGSPAVEGDLPADFPYAATLSPWAKDAVLWALSLGVEPMDPQAPLTHGEMDAILAGMSRKG